MTSETSQLPSPSDTTTPTISDQPMTNRSRPALLASQGIRFATTTSPTTRPSSPGDTTAPGGDADPSSPGSSDEQPETRSAGNGSSPESSPATTDTPSIPPLAEQVGIVIDTITQLANRYLTDDLGQQAGLYLADPADRDGMAGSGAKVLQHYGVPSIAGTGSRGALVTLAVAVAGYASKQLARAWDLRRIRKIQANTEQPQPEVTP